MAVRNFRIAAPGLAAFRRDLRRISAELGRAADRHIRETAAKVALDARRRAPRRSGRLGRSIRTSVRRGGASIYSNLEYAPVHEFGGTIRPRGAPISIEGKAYMSSAAEENMRFVDERMGDLLDGIARQHGFT